MEAGPRRPPASQAIWVSWPASEERKRRRPRYLYGEDSWTAPGTVGISARLCCMKYHFLLYSSAIRTVTKEFRFCLLQCFQNCAREGVDRASPLTRPVLRWAPDARRRSCSISRFPPSPVRRPRPAGVPHAQIHSVLSEAVPILYQ